MSIDLDTDKVIATRLRDVLKASKRSQKDVSDALQVPYKTVQGYLAGSKKIPATFVLGVCSFVGVDFEYLSKGIFQLESNAFRDAVYMTILRKGLASDKDLKSHTDAVVLAAELAVLIAERYDDLRKEDLVPSTRRAKVRQ